MNKHTHSSRAQGWANDEIASIGYRYSIWNEFETRVQDEFRYRGLYVPKVIHKHPYSFQGMKIPDREVLILWQSNKKYPTQTIPGTPLKIEYKYTDKTNITDFDNYYNVITGPGKHHKAENSEETFYGNYDEVETYRAVYQLEAKFAGNYQGIITNPPYPAIFDSSSSHNYLRLALTAIAGLALIPLAIAFSKLLHRGR